jgi:beta-lactamase class A
MKYIFLQRHKERYLSGAAGFIVGIFVMGASSVLFSQFNLREAERLSLLDPGAVRIDEQDLLVRFQPLRTALLSQYEQHEDFYIGLYFEYLPTGSNIVVNNNRAMWPASLIKIPVAMAALKKVERGEWQLQNELVIMDEDKDASFGTLYLEPSGTTMTIDALLKASLVDSDNTAHFVLLRNLDAEELEEVFTHLGLDEVLRNLQSSPETGTSDDNRMTAKTYSIFFRSLFNATYLSPDNSQRFLSYLSAGPTEYLRSGIPPEITFAHKTGIRTEDMVWADSGIVYEARRPYLLTVMLEQKDKTAVLDEGAVEALFTEISTQVYTYVHSLQ